MHYIATELYSTLMPLYRPIKEGQLHMVSLGIQLRAPQCKNWAPHFDYLQAPLPG